MPVNCPFCAEEIKPEAVVCKHCRRDLSIVKPLQEEIRRLTTTVAELTAEVEALRGATAQPQAAPMVAAAPAGVPNSRGGAVAVMAVPLLLLLLAHYLIVVRYDADTLILRMISIAIPLFSAVALTPLRRQGLAFSTVAGLSLGVVAVLAMSAVVSRVDQVPLLPTSAREWREIVEYMASIGLSFITGALLVRALGGRNTPTAAPSTLFVKLNRLVDRTVSTAESLEKRAQTLQNLFNATAPALAAAAAVATGLRSLL